MRASLQWMKEYVDFEGEPMNLADTLTMAGIPVEEVYVNGEGIENVVTGKLLSVDPHPNADKLVICQVDVGDEEPLQICTGANNVRAGQVVPVAKPNSYLPGGVHIKKSKLRGVPSEGMLCSGKELGLDVNLLPAAQKDGIYIMPEGTPINRDIREFLGLNDVVFEFELTPNRADCFSMIGLAREFATLFGGKLHTPDITVKESGEPANTAAQVEIAAEDLCERFSARLFRDVKIGPSPEWLVERLRSAGIRSINNVVDVTNYVMHEYGLPLHAYDYDTLAGHKLVCRRAEDGEKVTTLDDVERTLTHDQLVIADAQQAAGLAGIMGGARTEVTAKTTTILLEAAVFNGACIRRTSRKVGLRSDASSRYERGADTELTTVALDRAAQLLQEMDACTVAPGYLDVYPNPRSKRTVDVSVDWLNSAIGVVIPTDDMVHILESLSFGVELKDGVFHLEVPEWRGDVTEAADIEEEIARVYGYDNIPNKLPYGRARSGRMSDLQACTERISDVLSGMGLSETISFSFMDSHDLKRLNYPEGHELYRAIPVMNPITEEMPEMRTSLLPGLLQVLERNLAVKNENVAIYEYGALFLPKELPLKELPYEKKMLSGLLYGNTGYNGWNQKEREFDFYDLKGMMEEVLQRLGVTNYELKRAESEIYHPGKSAMYQVDGETLITFGELHPAAQENYDLHKRVYIFEIEVEKLVPLANYTTEYRRLPKYPAVERDLAILAPVGLAHETLLDIIRKQGGNLLEKVDLFDLYSGSQVPDGFVSMAFSLAFRAEDRTLKDSDVDERINRIVKRLKSFNCSLR